MRSKFFVPAPRAMRMPNSWRRCSMEYATTPKMPNDASTRENNAKDMARNMGKRRASTDCDTICVMGCKEVMGTFASMEWTNWRTAPVKEAGSVAVRRMNDADEGTEMELNQ